MLTETMKEALWDAHRAGELQVLLEKLRNFDCQMFYLAVAFMIYDFRRVCGVPFGVTCVIRFDPAKGNAAQPVEYNKAEYSYMRFESNGAVYPKAPVMEYIAACAATESANFLGIRRRPVAAAAV